MRIEKKRGEVLGKSETFWCLLLIAVDGSVSQSILSENVSVVFLP